MTLFFLSLGLCDENSLTLEGLEVLKNSDRIVVDFYTSKTFLDLKKLAKEINKKIEIVAREELEDNMDSLIEEAREKNVTMAVIGDVFAATTHYIIYLTAMKKGIKCRVIHNASVFNAISIIGLELYKFGQVTSIPFTSEKFRPDTPLLVLEKNMGVGLHTLFLLDLDPFKNKFLHPVDALKYLLEKERELGKEILNHEDWIVFCSKLGCSDFKIKSFKLKDFDEEKSSLMEFFQEPPYCMVIPARKLHFVEEEALEFWNSHSIKKNL